MNSDAKARISCNTAIGSTASTILAPATVCADDAEATCAGDADNDSTDAETEDAAWGAATTGACTPAAAATAAARLAASEPSFGRRVGLLSITIAPEPCFAGAPSAGCPPPCTSSSDE